MNGICHISFDDYLWDANGNINKIVGPRRPSTRAHYFNEENRLAAKSDWPGLLPLNTTISSSLASYLYSADGERVWKFAGTATMTYSNGQLVNSDLEMDKTFYPTPQTTFTKQKFYKHYYIGSERICTQTGKFTQTGNGPHSVGFIHGSSRSFIVGFNDMIFHSLDSVGYPGNFSIDSNFNSITTATNLRTKKYFYHYNHQGSVALVTYQNGTLQQHLQYLPYGGIFVDQRTSSYASPYTFSAKEKDAESGYTYFGARYYSDNMMMWLSVDPMSDKYPSMSPYMYCAGNPIKYFDPDGKEIWIINREGNKVQYTPNMSTEGFDNYTVETINALNKLSETKTMGVYINGFANTKVQQISIIENKGQTIADTKVNKNFPHSNPNQGILYDPSIGLEDVVTGETLSPALSLGHELGHIISAIIDPLGYSSRKNQTRNDVWTDDEEYYNITNFEHKIAEEWGELKRGGHNCNDAEGNIRYRTVEMKNSTSNEKRFE
ncbi:MAG: RHS repeat-associated core domain-containing protein [Bacteroidales bacterium]|nr:RHS repeat-associated core domain-containing protein [Bacteroidales bacterium]